MKPLMIMTTCNRLETTKIALASLRNTVDLDEIDLHVIDNGSTDGTAEWLATQEFCVDLLEENIGCPKALNKVLSEWRKPGQHVIKMDNDVEILTQGWLDKWLDFLDNVPDVAIIGGVGGHHQDTDDNFLANKHGYEYLAISPMGAFVIHSGAFMDKIGYFDVLAPNHLYGFEDNILVEKAQRLKWLRCILKEIQWKHRQIHKALPGDASGHIEEMRPLFMQRARAVAAGGSIYTGPDGIAKEIA